MNEWKSMSAAAGATAAAAAESIINNKVTIIIGFAATLCTQFRKFTPKRNALSARLFAAHLLSRLHLQIDAKVWRQKNDKKNWCVQQLREQIRMCSLCECIVAFIIQWIVIFRSIPRIEYGFCEMNDAFLHKCSCMWIETHHSSPWRQFSVFRKWTSIP